MLVYDTRMLYSAKQCTQVYIAFIYAIVRELVCISEGSTHDHFKAILEMNVLLKTP